MTDRGIDDRATMLHYKAEADRVGGRSEWAMRFRQCVAKLEHEWSLRDKNFGDGYAAATANMLAILDTLEIHAPPDEKGATVWNLALRTAAEQMWRGSVGA